MHGEKMNMENWNPNGGAIAFGHPNGASGARVCMFTMKELVRRGGRYGMFSSCCGGGTGSIDAHRKNIIAWPVLLNKLMNTGHVQQLSFGFLYRERRRIL